MLLCSVEVKDTVFEAKVKDLSLQAKDVISQAKAGAIKNTLVAQ